MGWRTNFLSFAMALRAAAAASRRGWAALSAAREAADCGLARATWLVGGGLQACGVMAWALCAASGARRSASLVVWGASRCGPKMGAQPGWGKYARHQICK